MKWSYCVTTVPTRRKSLLPRTLASLRAAGFDRPRLFVDGCGHEQAASYEAEFGLTVAARGEEALLIHGNWFLALHELLVREPMADRYAIFQDDFVAYRNLRGFLERCGYPDGEDGRSGGYLNLFTFDNNDNMLRAKGLETGWHEAALVNQGGNDGPDDVKLQGGRGALALVFDRQAVLALLSGRSMVERPLSVDRGVRSVDGGIANTLNKGYYDHDAGRWVRFREFIHVPSLVQHTGDMSTIGNAAWGGRGLALTFRDEEFDALELLKEHDYSEDFSSKAPAIAGA